MFSKNNNQSKEPSMPKFDFSQIGNRTQFFIFIGFISLYMLASSFYKIETSEQGVVTRFGAYSHTTDEGPHLKLPFGIDHVYKIKVTRIHEMQFGFRKNSRQLSKSEVRKESIMLTGDLNVAVVEWVLQYKISDPKKFLFHAANVKKIIHDTSISVMRRVVGDKLVEDILTTDRVQIAQNALRITQEVIDTYDMGIHIVKINLQNVTPPDPVKPAFNEINIARQEKEQMINQAKENYNKVIPAAKGKAQKKLTEAEAYAVKLINTAKGDSDRFNHVLSAYQAAPEVTKNRLYLETMEKIFSKMDQLTIIDNNIKGLLPVFNQAILGEKK